MKRSLTLRRETMTDLHPEELGSVVGAISAPHPLCVGVSIRYSECPTCGIACTYNCPTTS